MTKFVLPLIIAIGILFAVAPAQSQQVVQCPAGQALVGNYCQVVQCPAGQALVGNYCQVLPSGCDKRTSKLAFARATFNRSRRTIDVLAFITRRASGRVNIGLRAAGRTRSFTAPIDSAAGQIRIVRSIFTSQARLGTGIFTLTYNGDSDTRPQVVRLRAANNKARLSLGRPTITEGFLRASGRVTSRARGVVRVQLQFVNRADGRTITLERKAPIDSLGRWRLNYQLPPIVRAQIATRCGTVHSYTLFTGYLPRRIRGEMKSYQVLGSQ